jgi:hypothetical protein
MPAAGGAKLPKVTRVSKVDLDEGLACPEIRSQALFDDEAVSGLFHFRHFRHFRSL